MDVEYTAAGGRATPRNVGDFVHYLSEDLVILAVLREAPKINRIIETDRCVRRPAASHRDHP